MKKYDYLKDTAFLKAFYKTKNKVQYLKITALDFTSEKEVESIEGLIESGSINLSDGPVRRNGNFTFRFDKNNVSKNIEDLINIKKKIKIEIFFDNTLKKDFPTYADNDYIFFPQGIFIVTGVDFRYSPESCQVDMSFSDKMCLLDGTVGGVFTVDTILNEREDIKPVTKEDGSKEFQRIVEPIVIPDIIRELVNHIGGEQLGNIIIDMPSVATMIAKALPKEEYSTYEGCYVELPLKSDSKNIVKIGKPPIVDEGKYRFFKPGTPIGMSWKPFYYSPSDKSGQLIGACGTPATEVLNTLNNYLSDGFEYFYDVNGKFIWREKRNFVNTTYVSSLNKISNETTYSNYNGEKAAYIINDLSTVLGYSKNPMWENIKNDFMVCGGENNSEFFYHLAIDSKPEPKPLKETVDYISYDDNVKEELRNLQLSLASDYLIKIPQKVDSLPTVGRDYVLYECGGKYKYWDKETKQYVDMTKEVLGDGTNGLLRHAGNAAAADDEYYDYRTLLFLQGANSNILGADESVYNKELKAFWPIEFDMQKNTFYEQYAENPETPYYLEILDSPALDDISISAIGRRTIAKNEPNINCLFEIEVPEYFYLDLADTDANCIKTEEENKQLCYMHGYSYYPMELENSLKLSVEANRQRSAYEEITNLLYESCKHRESVSIDILQNFNLEPGMFIQITDPRSDIAGNYTIDSITINFGIEKSTTLSLIKIIDKL